MSETSVRETLQRLHSLLQSQRDLDPELTALLQELDRDIQNALSGQAVQPETRSDDADLSTRVQTVATRFAAEHPTLDMVLGELRTLLLGLGL
jgi:hypothetical protein